MATAAECRAESVDRWRYCSHDVQKVMFSALNSWLRNSWNGLEMMIVLLHFYREKRQDVKNVC